MRKTFLKWLAAAALALPFLALGASSPLGRVTGAITTQNLVAAGTCTASGCVEFESSTAGAMKVQVTGTYTASGGLVLQETINGTTWVTSCSSSCTTTFTRTTTGAQTATIASGVQDVFLVAVTGGKRVRITALGAVTGTATITIQPVELSLGGGGSSGGGGGAVTVADGSDAAQGTTTDSACATDNGTCTLVALQKRTNQRLTQIDTDITASNAQLPAVLGSQAAAASLGVTASTEDIARAGIITETAPASDTASSGQNGRLQRIAQNISTWIAKLTATANADANRIPASLDIASPVTGSAASAADLSNMPFIVGKSAQAVIVHVTANTATANFEFSVDGTAAYIAVLCWPSTGAGSVGSSSAPTTTGVWICPVQGTHFKVRQSGAGGVTATATPVARPQMNAIGVNISQILAIQGSGAHDAAISGIGVRTGCRARTSQYATTIANDDNVDSQCDLNGAAISKPYSVGGSDWSYAAATGGISNTTTAVTMAAAAGASIRNYITGCQVSSDALGAASELVIRDGASGTVLWRLKIGTAGILSYQINFASPIKSTANTLLEVATLTASVTGGVFINCQGYLGQ